MTYNIVIGVVLALAALYTFQKQGRIPNAVPLILIAIFGVSMVLFSDAPTFVPQLLAGAAIFVLGFACFAFFDDFGGGTAKVLAVIALLTPVSLLPYIAATLLAAYLALVIGCFIYYRIWGGYREMTIYYACLSLLISSIVIFLHFFGISIPSMS